MGNGLEDFCRSFYLLAQWNSRATVTVLFIGADDARFLHLFLVTTCKFNGPIFINVVALTSVNDDSSTNQSWKSMRGSK